MLKHKYIIAGKKRLEAILFGLSGKNLIVIRGSRGYIMCGYLNLKTAEKFKDVAIKVTGVSDINSVLKTNVVSCTGAARKLGIYKGQNIKDVLRIIA